MARQNQARRPTGAPLNRPFVIRRVTTRNTPPTKWKKLEVSIENLFTKKHFDEATGEWNGIGLKDCMSISEDYLPVSKARLLTQWRLEFMTLKADEEQIGAPG